MSGYDEYGRPIPMGGGYPSGGQMNMPQYGAYPPRQGIPPYVHKEPAPPPPPPPAPQPKPEQPGCMQQGKNRQTGFDLSGLLSNIKLDEEKTVIILLLILLARNGADMSLLIALGYLLM